MKGHNLSYLVLLHRGFWGPSLKSKEHGNSMLLLSLPLAGLVGQPELTFLSQWALQTSWSGNVPSNPH